MKDEVQWKKKVQLYIVQYRKWLSVLALLQRENVKLQHRLLSALQGPGSPRFLERAEALQSAFEQNALSLSLLRHEITVQSDMLLQAERPSETTRTALTAKHFFLERDLRKMQMAIGAMKSDCADLPDN